MVIYDINYPPYVAVAIRCWAKIFLEGEYSNAFHSLGSLVRPGTLMDYYDRMYYTDIDKEGVVEVNFINRKTEGFVKIYLIKDSSWYNGFRPYRISYKIPITKKGLPSKLGKVAKFDSDKIPFLNN